MKTILRGRKMSGRHLAELIDVPSSTLSDVLNGKTEPTLGMLLRMVHFLELRSIEELIAPFGTSDLRLAEYPDDGVRP